MGNFLSWPATKKNCESGSTGRLIFGLGEMQGWRISMEDAHAAVLDLDGSGESSNAFFAVYDGHGGPAVAKYAGQNLHKRLVAEESYKEQKWETALKQAFLGTDRDILANLPNEQSGCTAIAALVTSDDKLYVANAGDSRSVLSVKGVVKALSFDHKPTDAKERERIKAAGGYVENARVNGNLAMSRSLGDFQYKTRSSLPPEAQTVTADPDVTFHEITEEDEFLVVACDGIWDCLTSQQVVDFVRYQISEGNELTKICETIFDHCLAPDADARNLTGCDNMSLLIVGITHGRSKEEWYDWIKGRVKDGYGYKTPSAPPRLFPESRLITFQNRREAMEAREEEFKQLEAKEKEVQKEAREKEAQEKVEKVEAQEKEAHEKVESREEEAQEKEVEKVEEREEEPQRKVEGPEEGAQEEEVGKVEALEEKPQGKEGQEEGAQEKEAHGR